MADTKKISLEIPVSEDPIKVKEKGIELCNYLSEVGRYTDAAYFMLQLAENELSRLRDESLVEADKDPVYKDKAAPIKTAFGKSNIKFHVKIESPIKEDSFLDDIEGDYTYIELKKVYSFIEYKYNRLKSKLDQLQKAINYCTYYPVKQV